MLDHDNLLTAIKARINATSALSAIHNKVAYGLGVGLARPYARVSLLEGPPQETYGQSTIDRVLVTFSVFSGDLAQANSLAKAIANAFTSSPLALTGQTNLRAQRLGGRVLVEGNEAKNLVYQSAVDIAFWVQS
jgi:hypothetical protein